MPQTSILVVEDEPSLAQLIELNLQIEGYTVRRAINGQEAKAAISKEQPSLIVLDWMLPGQDGPSLLREWRGSVKTQDVPVLMLTARAEEEDKIFALDAGADDYLTKPFSVKELIARIRALLRRTGGTKSTTNDNSVLNLGPICVEPEQFRVAVGGVSVKLGLIEFRLLKTLIELRDRVQSRAQLIERVWGNDSSVEERTIDVHIKRLRASLGEAGDMIETVRGVGYRASATAKSI